MRFLSRTLPLLAVLSLAFVAGCDSDDDEGLPIYEGTFAATTFQIDFDEVSGDVLAEGGSFTLDFNADGTVYGESTIPAAFTEPGQGDSNVEADGTYTLNGSMLTFDFDGEADDENDNFLGEFVTDTADWVFDQDDGEIRADIERATIVLERR